MFVCNANKNLDYLFETMSDIFEFLILLQVAKKTAQKSKIILTDIERWQKVSDFYFFSPFCMWL